MLRFALVMLAGLSVAAGMASGGDWPQFRGPNADGISQDGPVPVEFSESQNLAWKAPLPGPGSSSPIVVGDRVLVTSWSGYGADGGDNGSTSNMTRHLVCFERHTGQQLWAREVKATAAEDPYTGFIREHGYASSTPVSDGKAVYAFFGKTGVSAFDLDGKPLWQTSVGTGSSNRRWGSGSSLVLAGGHVIVNASEEGRAILALDTATGVEKWKTEADLLELAYGTPRVVDHEDGRQDLVLAVPEEVWGLNPDNGRLRWYCQTSLTGNISPSVNELDGMLYVFGGFRGAGSLAIRSGGSGDVTADRVAWTSRTSSYVATPVLTGGHLYWVDDNGQAFCVAALTGEQVYRERLVTGTGGRPVYASPILCDGRLYCVSRRNGVYVLAARPEFTQLAHNEIAGDDSDFNASPAISDGQMFIRSDRNLYCIQATK